MAEKLLMMALSPTMTEGTITKWKVAEGAAFKAGALLCEVETDKASMDYEAPKDAVLLKILLPEGGKAAVGDPIAVIGSAGEDPGPAIVTAAAAVTATAAAKAISEARDASSSYPPSSPLARSLARDLGLDLRGVKGSGPGGRVVERDVRGLASRGSSAPQAAAPQSAAPQAAAPASLRSGPATERRVPVSGKRAVIARRLSESFFTAPHFYLKRRADSGALMALREAVNAGRDKAISLNAFLVKLAAEAIARHPYVNSSWAGDSIVERSSIDIGLAVALPDGLITPLVKDCARKSVAAIAEELSLLIAKAKDKGLQPAEYEGAGFTISNLGSYGVEEFTAIINPPGSAILAVGAAVKEPFAREDGSIGVRRAMALTLGCDHRVIDGAAGARFLSTLVSFIENPGKALV
jgi:pyruvate dehydrogenase E2 component (dihydrolipoamide acetyltransferase)